MARLDIKGRFGAVATVEMVEQAKPAPDLYLLATEKLAVASQACLAVEDTPRGIQSARSAGMTVIGLRAGSSAHLDHSGADHVIDSLESFDFSWLG